MFDNRFLFCLTSSAALTMALDNDDDETTSAVLTTMSDNGDSEKDDISRSIMSFYVPTYSIKLYYRFLFETKYMDQWKTLDICIWHHLYHKFYTCTR